MTRITGAAYEPEVDKGRLRTQMLQVLDVLSNGDWWTVTEITDEMNGHGGQGTPEPSVSAQIRNLRKKGNGGYQITGRYRKGLRIYEYRLEGHWRETPNGGADQGEMF